MYRELYAYSSIESVLREHLLYYTCNQSLFKTVE
nr:MAG TPA_asm: hypothetical protein [Bacteriophage sp.]